MTNAFTTILPPATLGMLGGGQLGAMFVDAAHQLGYKVHVFSPTDDEPACLKADFKTIAPYDDLNALRHFASSVAAISYEFENVPSACADACAALAPVRPGQHVLSTAQHRVREKTFFNQNHLPCGMWAQIKTAEDLLKAAKICGFPAILKTAHGGYDGKGQCVVKSDTDLERAWQELNHVECVLEAFVDFAQEVSVVAARSVSGKTVCYGPILNTHKNHILDLSVFPAPTISEKQTREAVDLASRLMEKLQVVGVLCVELFQTKDGHFLCNEIAPRPHNSGHLTMDGFNVSQFHQQVLALCGRDTQDIHSLGACAMSNLLGDVWFVHGKKVEPNWAAAQKMPNVHLHLYGKKEAHLARKMGHINALAASPEEAIRLAQKARELLNPLATKI